MIDFIGQISMTTTTTSTFPIRRSIGVLFVKWMTELAMGLLSVLQRSAESSVHIFSMRDHFQMRWIHACSIAADMIYVHLRNNFDIIVKFIRKTVSHYSGDSIKKKSISLRGLSGDPLPTSSRFDNLNFRKETFNCGSCFCHNIIYKLWGGVVNVAQHAV